MAFVAWKKKVWSFKTFSIFSHKSIGLSQGGVIAFHLILEEFLRQWFSFQSCTFEHWTLFRLVLEHKALERTGRRKSSKRWPKLATREISHQQSDTESPDGNFWRARKSLLLRLLCSFGFGMRRKDDARMTQGWREDDVKVTQFVFCDEWIDSSFERRFLSDRVIFEIRTDPGPSYSLLKIMDQQLLMNVGLG